MLAEEILMVNDGSLLLKMMGGLLENKGYHISLTDSPEEALVLLSTRNIVLVVIKLNGQQTDRLAVTHMVRELNGGTKLILLGESAHLPAEIFEMDADDYILLPCRSSEVWRRLVSSLESGAPTQPARSPGRDLVHPLNRRVLNNLGLMFHDVRGHLTSISEGLKLLDRKANGRLDQELESIFQETFRKSRTLIRVAEEFLQKFHDQDSIQWPTKIVDLQKEVVAPILEEMKDDLKKNCITLDNRLSWQSPAKQIRGDRVALKSVFRNLLHNAIIYGGHGCSISIEVNEDPHYFSLRVKNSGTPISPKRRQELFTGLRKDQGNGQGLGLHLGREVLRSQGGDIFCEPCQQGTNFVMTLPRA
jgi:CheY-like chemotaxis protein